MKKLNIAIMGHMPAKGYSGGRYCAWIMAEALAHQGNRVYVITNNIPEFREDFIDYPHHNEIEIVLTGDFYSIPKKIEKLDYVICVPTIGMNKTYYYACLDLAMRTEARFSFVNFETPNWYEEYAQMGRPKEDYEYLQKICKYGCLVMSLAYESQKYAKTFYNEYVDKTDYIVWSPPINSFVAEQIHVEREEQIIAFVRLRDKHKGGDDILELIGEGLRGKRLVLVVGNGEVDESYRKEIEQKAKAFEIEIAFKKKLTDREKFIEIKKSKILLFPSHFEGYGYPPVEALYCGTKCIVFELPVLREVSGDALVYCEQGDIAMMGKKAEQLLQENDFEPLCVDTADFKKQSQRLHNLLNENMSNDKLTYKRSKYELWCNEFRKCYFTLIKNGMKKKILPDMIKYCIEKEITISKKLKKEGENWRSVRKELKGKKVYIWGCGKAYQELYPKYRNLFVLEGLLDSNPDKIGRFDFVNKTIRVQSPEILLDVDANQVVVLISNKEHVDEIIEKLESMNIKNYHSLCMIAMNSGASRIYRFIKKGRQRER